MRRVVRRRDVAKACAAWLLAPHVPEWVPAWELAGWARFEARGEGCWRVAPFPYPVLWIAANELPLREELIPFLAARSGKKLEDFVRWIGTRRSPAWLAEMVRSLPEVTTMLHVAKSAWPPEVLAEMADNNAKLVSADMKKKVDQAKADIIAGKIKVVDYMAKNECK